MKQKLTESKDETDNSVIIFGDPNIAQTIMDRTTIQDKWEIIGLNNPINQVYLTDICRTLYPNTRIYILLKCSWNVFQDIPQKKSQ